MATPACTPKSRRTVPDTESRGSRSSPGSSGSRISGCCAIRIRRRRSVHPARHQDRRRRSSRRRRRPICSCCSRDAEARVRRRAALALGRVGLPEAVEPLTRAAWRRGARGAADGGVRPRPHRRSPARAAGAARRRSAARDAVLQGRAAEALGLIGDKADAPAIGEMVRAHVAAGRADGRAARRPGIAARAAGRGRAPRPLRAGAPGRLRAAGRGRDWRRRAAGVARGGRWPMRCSVWATRVPRRPCSRCCPRPGRYTASFAVRGLAAAKAAQPQALAAIRAEVEQPRDAAVMIQAIRALAALNDRAACPLRDPRRGRPRRRPGDSRSRR